MISVHGAEIVEPSGDYSLVWIAVAPTTKENKMMKTDDDLPELTELADEEMKRIKEGFQPILQSIKRLSSS